MDGTDDPTHGNQQMTFFHGYYDQYMYHPLVIYDADNVDLVTATLRPGNKHASYGTLTLRGGTCEVRIDELKNRLKADRLSCHRFLANQFRLFLHMAAYWLIQRLRQALQNTEFASFQIQQLRLKLMKIGGQVLQTARRVWFRWVSGYPWKDIFVLAYHRLVVDSS